MVVQERTVINGLHAERGRILVSGIHVVVHCDQWITC